LSSLPPPSAPPPPLTLHDALPIFWLVTLVPLVRGRRGLAASTLLAGALVLTQLWFPSKYWWLVYGFHTRETILVVARDAVLLALDRQSTRLISSHVAISYAVFCLK